MPLSTEQPDNATQPVSERLLHTPFLVFKTSDGSQVTPSMEERADTRQLCRWLEEGAVIYFPQSPFILSQADHEFLLKQEQDGNPTHKNISYRPMSKVLRGVPKENPETLERMKTILDDYKTQTTGLFQTLLTPYQRHWRYDYGSFRPLEEAGRKLRLRARNDLIHVDSFTTRWMNGDRIFRVFVNLNPSTQRVWRTGRPFSHLAEQFKDERCAYSSQENPLRKLLNSVGIKTRPAYDRWMLDFHNFLKENEHFQAHCESDTWSFPAGSAWMTYTDCTSHSVLSGQYAIEQTYIIAKDAMVKPEASPIQVLEKLYS